MIKEKYRIRTLHEFDIPFFNTVRNECSEFLHDNSKYTLPESYSWYRTNKNPYFIYELNNESVGYFRTSNWNLNSCYVGLDIHKDYRGKGLATDAYRRFFKYLNENHSIYSYSLEVLESNQRAFNLYKKLGFKVIGSYIDKNGNFSYKMKLDENR